MEHAVTLRVMVWPSKNEALRTRTEEAQALDHVTYATPGKSSAISLRFAAFVTSCEPLHWAFDLVFELDWASCSLCSSEPKDKQAHERTQPIPVDSLPPVDPLSSELALCSNESRLQGNNSVSQGDLAISIQCFARRHVSNLNLYLFFRAPRKPTRWSLGIPTARFSIS